MFFCQYARRRDTTRTVKQDKDGQESFRSGKNIEIGFQKQLKISGNAAYTDSNQIANASVNSIQIGDTLCQQFIVKFAQQGEKLQKLWNHKSFCKNSSQDKKSNKSEPKGQ